MRDGIFLGRAARAGGTLLLAVVIPACTALPGGTPSPYGGAGPGVGTVLVSGPYVTVNGQPAANGMAIGSGDLVATGPSSSAKVLLFAGGSVQLDQDTDPGFFERVHAMVECALDVAFDRGQIYVEGHANVCVSHGPENIIPHSGFNLLARSPQEVLTVAEGQVSIRGPEPAEVPAGVQVVIEGGRITRSQRLTPGQIAEVIAWRDQYAFSPPRQRPRYPIITPFPAPIFRLPGDGDRGRPRPGEGVPAQPPGTAGGGVRIGPPPATNLGGTRFQSLPQGPSSSPIR